MNTQRPTDLAIALRGFFHNHLPQVMGASAHTIWSYRDSLKLLLTFVARDGRKPESLSFDDLSVHRVIDFLSYLETERGNAVSTRNNRLAAIHSFFRYVASVAPDHLELAQRILAIPLKRAGTRVVEYFQFDEFQAVLNRIDLTTECGRRDHALLVFMFNTGARAQEVCDLRGSDLSLAAPLSVRIVGKGRKQRICPIWSVTARQLGELMEEKGIDPREPVPVFTNRRGNPLTRFGIRYILDKRVSDAAASCRTLEGRRLHPHSIRHSTAVHLLKSGVDLASIAAWLGHASVNTTGKYAAIDLDMKREAIARAAPPSDRTEESPRPWHSPDILAWLEAL